VFSRPTSPARELANSLKTTPSRRAASAAVMITVGPRALTKCLRAIGGAVSSLPERGWKPLGAWSSTRPVGFAFKFNEPALR
jgi:hypothetical protein